MDADKLTMTFDPHTIEHLGIKMYSVLPNAIAELIANSYDAEATCVYIKLYDNEGKRKISITDNGIGMSFDEINKNFLRIGRKRRINDNGLSFNKIRKVTGRKGLGKLAFFGIGDTIRITTFQGGECTCFTLNWYDLIHTNGHEYSPSFTKIQCDPGKSGTVIELDDLKRKSDFDVNSLSISLAKLFNFYDESFKVYITKNDESELLIENKLKYQNLPHDIVWDIPSTDIKNKYLEKHNISGQIIASNKPLKPGLRGVTLYAHGRLVNAPEFFGVGESSHGYSYITGWLNVDFIDELNDDVISTDRQSLSWDLPETTELQINLKHLLSAIERDWRNKRKLKRKDHISKTSKIDINKWFEKLPSNVKSNVDIIVNNIVDNSELPEEKQINIVNVLHNLIPEYPYFHWRALHHSVQDASFSDYKNKDYYRATFEAIKRFESIIQHKIGSKEFGRTLMAAAFGNKNEKLSVTSKYKKSDGTDFSIQTIENVEEGQKHLSMGLMTGVRNPLAHEEIQELHSSDLFSEKDCLDILSLLSYLFKRLDDSVIRESK